MQKKSKKQDKRSNVNHNDRRQVRMQPLPPIINVDVIALFSDDELSTHTHGLHAQRSQLDPNQDPKPWDVEIAYAQRELNLRQIGREMHEKYYMDNEYVFENDTCEDSWPSGDFDNSKFINPFGGRPRRWN